MIIRKCAALPKLPIFWNWTLKHISDRQLSVGFKIRKSAKSLHPTSVHILSPPPRPTFPLFVPLCYSASLSPSVTLPPCSPHPPSPFPPFSSSFILLPPPPFGILHISEQKPGMCLNVYLVLQFVYPADNPFLYYALAYFLFIHLFWPCSLITYAFFRHCWLYLRVHILYGWLALTPLVF